MPPPKTAAVPHNHSVFVRNFGLYQRDQSGILRPKLTGHLRQRRPVFRIFAKYGAMDVIPQPHLENLREVRRRLPDISILLLWAGPSPVTQLDPAGDRNHEKCCDRRHPAERKSEGREARRATLPNIPADLLLEARRRPFPPGRGLHGGSDSHPRLQLLRAFAALFQMPQHLEVALHQELIADIGVHVPPDFFAAALAEIDDFHAPWPSCEAPPIP